jgi:aerobic C4-dicarboxylate transport protein
MTLLQQITLLFVLLLTSKGAAGVTGSGFIVLAATLSAVGHVPVAGMALILGIDRFMSECRSITNFIGNAVATIVIARWEGGLDRAALNAALAKSPATFEPVLESVLPPPALDDSEATANEVKVQTA